VVKQSLTDSHFKALVTAAPEGGMICGMALSFWDTYLWVEPPSALAADITPA